MLKNILLIVLSVLFAQTVVLAKDVYVDAKNGNDSNLGTFIIAIRHAKTE